MKVFITGSTGFIGRNLKEQLSDKYEIYAPTSAQLDLLDEDTVRRYLHQHEFDVVIHAATWNATRTSKKDLSKVLHQNLRMFFALAGGARFYKKMIYYGSGAEYDRRYWVPSMKEEYFGTHMPADDYGFSKYIMAKFAETAGNIYNLRLFGVFGRYEDWRIRFISNACCKAAWDLPITIKQNVYFDYMYIDDLIKITEWFIENESRGRVYNVCTGKTIDLLGLAKIVLEISGKKLPIHIAGEGLGTEYSGSNARLQIELRDSRFRDTAASVAELYQWYLDNREGISRERLLYDA